MQFKHLIPEGKLLTARAGARCHDLIEDCRQTYNNVKKATNKEVAEIAYALTNEKGKSRSERANEKYYFGIRQVELAVFLKLCDRIANIKHGLKRKSEELNMYREESSTFYDKMKLDKYPEYKEMITFMNELLTVK